MQKHKHKHHHHRSHSRGVGDTVTMTEGDEARGGRDAARFSVFGDQPSDVDLGDDDMFARATAGGFNFIDGTLGANGGDDAEHHARGGGGGNRRPGARMGGGGGAAENPPDLVPVLHPLDADIEGRLGPAADADSHCYVCNVLDVSDPGKISDDGINLLNFIEAIRRNNGDMVDASTRVKEWFDRRIRDPTNAIANSGQHVIQGDGTGECLCGDELLDEDQMFDASQSSGSDAPRRQSVAAAAAAPPQAHQQIDAVAEWTKRSIYNHLVYKDMSPMAQLDRGAAIIDRMMYTLNRSCVFVAEKSVVGDSRTVDIKDVKIDDRGCAKMVALLRTGLAYNKARLEQTAMARGGTLGAAAGGGGAAASSPAGSRLGSNSGALTSSNLRRTSGGVTKRPAASSSISALNVGSKPQKSGRSGVRSMFV